MSQPWRILLLTHEGHVAGSTYSISYLAKQLSQQGHHVVVGCRADSLLARLLQNTNVLVEPMRFKGRLDWQNIRHIAQVVRQHNIQVLNPQSSYDRFTSLLAVRWYRLAVVVLHTRRQMPLSRSLTWQCWLHRGIKYAMIAVSTPVRNALVRKGVPAALVHVVRNGIPQEKYNPTPLDKNLRHALGLDDGFRLVVAVSRLKRQDQLLAAIAQGNISQRLVLCFIGIAEPAAYVPLRLAVEAQGHRVIYKESIPNADVLSYISLAHLKVLCSTTEGLSQSLLEAMALGVPVIATAAGGNQDLIKDQVNGLLFEDQDIDGLNKHIEHIITNSQWAKQLGMAGQQTAKQYSMDAVARAYVSVIEQVAKNNTL